MLRPGQQFNEVSGLLMFLVEQPAQCTVQENLPCTPRQDRQSQIASNFQLQTQIATLFAILMYRTVELRIANRAFRIAISNHRRIWSHESRVIRSLAILDLDRAMSPI